MHVQISTYITTNRNAFSSSTYIYIYLQISTYIYIYVHISRAIGIRSLHPHISTYIHTNLHVSRYMYKYLHISAYTTSDYNACLRTEMKADVDSMEMCEGEVGMCVCSYGVAMMSRLLKIIGLFCKRTL